jgi:uncharacterized protein YecE (DUF72 family)
VSRLLIGLPQPVGKLANYAKRYGMVEVLADTIPTPSAVKRWRRQVPPSFAFSLVLPRIVSELKTTREASAALASALEAAHALEANCLVLLTPPTIRPTAQNRERIIELAGKLPHGGQLRAWEPRGIWSPDEIGEVAQAGDWLPVVDAAEQAVAPGAIAYTRIRALGRATRLSQGRLQRIAAQLVGRREVYVVAEPPLGAKLANALPQAIDSIASSAAIPQLFRPSAALELDRHDEEQ